MNVLDFAIDIEKKGESFYKEVASITENAGLKKILIMLADEETKHIRTFEKMKNGEYELPASDLEKQVNAVFSRMKGDMIRQGADMRQVDLYKQALEFERQSKEFYSVQAGASENSERKDILSRIAEEESKHYLLIENIIDFITDPERHLEDAEFYRIDGN